jgi:bis(5'-nucleosyl)-tetraphosphatase (symmetrical)
VRRIFIGDIQGCLAPLDELLRRLCLRATDRLYCVGDLVNRSPDSLGVLRRLRDLGADCVLGNHDLHLLQVASGCTEPSSKDRLEGVFAAEDREPLLAWLASQPIMHVESDLALVHAGLQPSWFDLPAVAQGLNTAKNAHLQGHLHPGITFATEVRYCDPQGRRPARDEPPPAPPFAAWDEFYGGDRIVVFGHWARRGLVVKGRLRGLDSGCVYGKALTAWIAEEDRLVQVPGWQRSQLGRTHA